LGVIRLAEMTLQRPFKTPARLPKVPLFSRPPQIGMGCQG
jgi:hypothetical protein